METVGISGTEILGHWKGKETSTCFMWNSQSTPASGGEPSLNQHVGILDKDTFYSMPRSHVTGEEQKVFTIVDFLQSDS